MSTEEPGSPSSSFCEAAGKVLQPCLNFISNFSFGHPVHPAEPLAPPFSEYLLLNHRKRLRVIHLKPNVSVQEHNSTEAKKRTSRSSLSEEYWFTRWNRPLKLGNCNCSFRRSQRFSLLSSHRLPLSINSNSRSSNVSTYDVPAVKIVNLDTFVERLIQETLFEAFQEFLVKQSSKQPGLTNLGFDEKDEFDGVVLRKPFKKPNDDNKRHDSKRHDSTNLKRNCKHGNSGPVRKKPVVLLLHGIGSSAEVWWNIINTLVYKGYEIIAPDMLGHGYSSVPNRPGAYTFKNFLKYTLAVFDQYIGCDESKRAIVIGHSYGCSLATALCRYRSQQIVQLILISGGGPTPLAPPVQGDDMSLANCLSTLLKPFLFCGVKRTILYSLRGKHFETCSPNSGVPNYVLQYIASGQNWPDGDAAFHRRILIPTLLVHGLQDDHVTLVQECEMERTIPRAFLELIPNAGHMCMLETPEHLSHMIMCFIDWWSR